MSDPTVLYLPDLPGKTGSPFPGKAEVVTLRDEESGAATYLVRMAPGGDIAPHSHAAAAQHYVMEGECQSRFGLRKAGTYHLFPAHATVGPITSEKGAVLLIVLDPSSA